MLIILIRQRYRLIRRQRQMCIRDRYLLAFYEQVELFTVVKHDYWLYSVVNICNAGLLNF